MDIKAIAQHQRLSSRRSRLVINMVRGKMVNEAITILRFSPSKPAKTVLKLLNSAIANAQHNFSLKSENLKIVRITADNGPVLKRHMPRAHGSASLIRKPLTHIAIYLQDQASDAKVKKEKIAKKETTSAQKINKKKPDTKEKKSIKLPFKK
ncbi:MAG: 50S ribosomal protein L22 [Candidatus Komeilibacteria bacterium CG_4_10_14_0_2_um_filter_37_10]|uniref:Large ribosomal subunit protein uL22 n=1 Tax=Candidatus Komeilibacteria bacterium CG_4_10_14_0_2_um_filter_37_10 TaxID=1974470 RepID=A0A2M7VED1_9BACT|nr:MAG: 50S ribosomal protein L22 [Candidatus Komeilibacteria bacterium CG_4_10_14_0_2_um_filter_37_10]